MVNVNIHGGLIVCSVLQEAETYSSSSEWNRRNSKLNSAVMYISAEFVLEMRSMQLRI